MQRLAVTRYRPGVLLLAGLSLVFIGVHSDSNQATASGRLTNLLLQERFTVGRLAGQAEWQPCVPVDSTALVPRLDCGESPRLGSPPFEQIFEAARAARTEIRSDTTVLGIRAGALLDLRWRDVAPSRLDRAVASLERARRLAPADVVVLNDLAVAYLEMGERDQQLMPMLRALDAIGRALAQDSTHPAVLFNRALILQRLYLVKSAERAWARYLEVERHPRWRAEAEAHARGVEQVVDTASWAPLLESPPKRMDAPIRAEIAARARRSPQAAREFGFPLLARWGAAVERGDQARAIRFLSLAREIGAASETLGVDRSVSLAVHAIDAAAGDSHRLLELARGHVALQEGRLLYERRAYDDAITTLHGSERSLRAAGSPAARWALFYRAASEVNSVDYASGDRLFNRLVAEAGPEEPALAGKAIWALGLSQLRRGNYDMAIRRYREAMPLIASAREAENQGAIEVLLAEGLALAGQWGEGRARAYHALRLLSPFRQSGFLNNHLAIVASYARTEGYSYAALSITDELVLVARDIGRPTTVALALCAQGSDLMAVGHSRAAGAVLKEASQWADSIPPDRGGNRVRARVKLILGQLMRSRDPVAALRMLSEAADAYSSFGSDFYLPTVLYEAALAARAVGDPVKARRWLQQAIEHVERQQASFQGTEARATFYETVEKVFDAMISLELEDERPEAAFRTLERGRIHAWSADGRRASSSGAETASASLARIGASLPADMLFVEYALLREHLVIWTVSRRGTGLYTVAVPRDSVAALVDRFEREVTVPASGSTDARSRLFDLLIRPIAAELRDVRQLTVVPDRELFRVPFAALWDRTAGRYAIEQYQIRTVPSAGFFLAASSRAPGAGTGTGVLVVGDPSLEPAEAGRLGSLPGAAREARIVAGLYPGSVLLSSADARRGRVLGLLPAHSIFHFAGHAVFNPEQPEMSYLAFAPDEPGKSGILRAWEIGGLRLSNVDVVVLSACSSLSPRTSRSGAIAGLAYSFLRAGAPATVSTLWDVDDGATMELVTRFHHHLAAGTPAAEALRLAQVEALKSTRPELRAPEAWAAFIYTGP